MLPRVAWDVFLQACASNAFRLDSTAAVAPVVQNRAYGSDKIWLEPDDEAPSTSGLCGLLAPITSPCESRAVSGTIAPGPTSAL